MIKAINSVANVVSEPLALALARNILLKPKRVASKWPKDIKKVVVETSQGKLATYTYGEGKAVWLVHHWSKSANSLLPLIRKLVRQGFCVHAIDLPGHGASEGTHVNLSIMSQAFDEFANDSLMPHTIITHGLGASVVANSGFFKRYTNNLVMLNPRLNVVDVMHKVAQRYGISDQVLSKVLKQSLRGKIQNLSDLNMSHNMAQFGGHVKVVEEKAKLSTFSLVKQLA